MSASAINALALLEKLNGWHAIYTTNEILSGAHAVYQINTTSTQELLFDLVHKINVSGRTSKHAGMHGCVRFFFLGVCSLNLVSTSNKRYNWKQICPK